MSSKFCADRIIALKNSEFTPTCEDSRWDHENVNVYLRNNTKLLKVVIEDDEF